MITVRKPEPVYNVESALAVVKPRVRGPVMPSTPRFPGAKPPRAPKAVGAGTEAAEAEAGPPEMGTYDVRFTITERRVVGGGWGKYTSPKLKVYTMLILWKPDGVECPPTPWS